jgi:hypothetical protein
VALFIERGATRDRRPIKVGGDVASMGLLPYRLKKHRVDELMMGCCAGHGPRREIGLRGFFPDYLNILN